MKTFVYEVYCKRCVDQMLITITISGQYEGIEYRYCPQCGDKLSVCRALAADEAEAKSQS